MKFLNYSIAALLTILSSNGYAKVDAQTQLHIACINGDAKEVKKWINEGADINAPTSYGDSCLTLASGHGNLALIEYLLNNGADAAFENNSRKTAEDYVKSLVQYEYRKGNYSRASEAGRALGLIEKAVQKSVR
ncbi:MAG: ankyrin repeat domain-containing protein [Bdellovibrionota bacterium]